LRKLAGDFARRVHAFARKHKIPLRYFAIGDKTKHAQAEKLRAFFQSNCKAKKIIFIFLALDWNRELGILCSCHSITSVRPRSVVGGYSPSAANISFVIIL
jgi:hypothetical protein